MIESICTALAYMFMTFVIAFAIIIACAIVYGKVQEWRTKRENRKGRV